MGEKDNPKYLIPKVEELLLSSPKRRSEEPTDNLTRFNKARNVGLRAGQTGQVPSSQFTTGLEGIADKLSNLRQVFFYSGHLSINNENFKGFPEERYELRYVPLVTPAQYWFAWRGGYTDGLRQFMRADGSKRMPLPESLVASVNTAINTLSGANGYAHGVALETPKIERRTLQRRISSMYPTFSEEKNEQRKYATAQLIADQRRRGYHVGFAVAVVREYGVVLAEAEIPSDTPSYNAFMRGLKPEAEVPLDIALLRLGLRENRREEPRKLYIQHQESIKPSEPKWGEKIYNEISLLEPKREEIKPLTSILRGEMFGSKRRAEDSDKEYEITMDEVYRLIDDACYKAGLRVSAANK